MRLVARERERVELVEEQHGRRVAARLPKSAARLRSLWPTHMLRMSLMPTAVKLALHSVAMARAIIVLPQPGGP